MAVSAAASVVGGLFHANHAHAQSYTQTASGNWSSGTSWVGGTAPTSNSNNNIYISDTSGTVTSTDDNSGNFQLQTLNLNNTTTNILTLQSSAGSDTLQFQANGNINFTNSGGGGIIISSNINLNNWSNASLTIQAAAATQRITFSGNIAETGSGGGANQVDIGNFVSPNSLSGGVVVLTGSNSNLGNIVFSSGGGTVVVSNSANIGGAAFEFNAGTNNSEIFASASFNNTSNLNFAGSGIDAGMAAASGVTVTFSGAFGINGGPNNGSQAIVITPDNQGTVVFTTSPEAGDTGNGHSGTLTIDAGTLRIDSGVGSSGINPVTINGGTLLFNNSTQYNVAVTMAGSISTPIIDVTAGNTATLNAIVAGSGGLTKGTNSGTLVFGGNYGTQTWNSTYSGGTYIDGGTLAAFIAGPGPIHNSPIYLGSTNATDPAATLLIVSGGGNNPTNLYVQAGSTNTLTLNTGGVTNPLGGTPVHLQNNLTIDFADNNSWGSDIVTTSSTFSGSGTVTFSSPGNTPDIVFQPSVSSWTGGLDIAAGSTVGWAGGGQAPTALPSGTVIGVSNGGTLSWGYDNQPGSSPETVPYTLAVLGGTATLSDTMSPGRTDTFSKGLKGYGTLNITNFGAINFGGTIYPGKNQALTVNAANTITTQGSTNFEFNLLTPGSNLAAAFADAGSAGSNDLLSFFGAASTPLTFGTGNTLTANYTGTSNGGVLPVGNYILFDYTNTASFGNTGNLTVNSISGDILTLQFGTTTSSINGLANVGYVDLIVTVPDSRYYWNGTNTSSPAQGLGGNGNWNTSAASWLNGPASTTTLAWSNASTSDAIFGTNSGAVVLTTNITANSLTFNASGYTISSTNSSVLTLAQGSTLTGCNQVGTINMNGNATISAAVAGTNGVIVNGTSTLTLSGTNTFSGGLSINTARVSVSADSGLGNSANNITINNGTLLASGGSFTDARGITLAGTTNTVDVASANSLTLTGVIGGSGGLIKGTSGGLLQLADSSANTYTGITIINSGILSVAADNNLGATAASNTVTINAGATLLDNTGFNSPNRGIILGGGSDTIDVASGNSLTISGTVTGGGNLVKGTSAGTLFLANTGNTYSGGSTTINGGTLANAAANALPTGTALTDNATYNLNGFAQTLSGAIGGSGTITASSAGTLTANDASNYTMGPLVAGSVSLVQAGPGTLTLGQAESYTGSTTISGGTLANGVNNALPTGTALTDNATYNLNGFAQTLSGAIGGSGTITASSAGTLTANDASNYTMGPLVAGSVSLVQAGPGTLTLGQAESYTGSTTISGGTLANGVNNALPTGTALTDNATYNLNGFAQTLSGAIGGSGTITASSAGTLTANDASNYTMSPLVAGSVSLVQAGPGTLTLGQAESYTGSTTISGGTLANGVNNALPTGTALTDNATYNLNGFAQTLSGAIGGSGTITASSAGTLTANDASNYTMGPLLAGSVSLVQAGMGTLTLGQAESYTGSTTISGGTLANGVNNALPTGTALTDNATYNLNGFAQTLSGAIGGSGTITASSAGTLTANDASNYTMGPLLAGSVSLVQAGTGTLTLARVESYTGSTTISGGTLANGVNNALPTGTALTDNGTYNLSTFSQTLTAAIAGSGTITASSGGMLTLNSSSNYTMGPVLSGALSLVQAGGGTLTLSGTEPYSGTTVVSGGKLVVSGYLSNTNNSVTVSSGGTLGGSGTIAGSVTINGGHIGPSDPSTFSMGSLNLNNGTELDYQLNATNTAAGGPINDLIAVSGNVNFSGTQSLVISGGPLNAGGDYTLMTFGTETGLMATNITVVGGGIGHPYTIVSTATSNGALDLDVLTTSISLTPSSGTSNNVFVSSNTVTNAISVSVTVSNLANPSFSYSGTASGGTPSNVGTYSGTIGGTVAMGASMTNTVLLTAGMTAGTTTGTITVADTNSADGNASQTNTLTANVFNHALLAINGNTGAATVGLGHVTQGQAGSQGYAIGNVLNVLTDGLNLNSITAGTSNSSLISSGLSTFSTGLAASTGGTVTTNNYTASLSSTLGIGTQSASYTLTYGDHDAFTGQVTNNTATLNVTATVDALSAQTLTDYTAGGSRTQVGTINVSYNGVGPIQHGGFTTVADQSKGYVTITVNNGTSGTWPADGKSTILVDVKDINSPGSLNTELQSLVSDLSAYASPDSLVGLFSTATGSGNQIIGGSGYDYLTTPTNGQVPGDGGSYDLELVYDDVPVQGTTYFTFDYSNPAYGDLTVDRVAVVPEPSSLALLGFGAAGLMARRRGAKKSRKKARKIAAK